MLTHFQTHLPNQSPAQRPLFRGEPEPTPPPPPVSPEKEAAKSRLLKHSKRGLFKLAAALTGFRWLQHLAEPEGAPRAIKSILGWTAFHLAALGIPLYTGWTAYNTHGQIQTLETQHDQQAASIEQFKKLVEKQPEASGWSAGAMWQKTINTFSSETPEAKEIRLKQAVIASLPQEKAEAATQILDPLLAEETPSPEAYRDALKSFVRLVNQDRPLDPENQARLEAEVVKAFDEGASSFQFPAFESPAELAAMQKRYFLFFLFSSLALGAFVAGEFAYGFVMSKVSAVQTAAEVAKDLTVLMQKDPQTVPNVEILEKKTVTNEPDPSFQ